MSFLLWGLLTTVLIYLYIGFAPLLWLFSHLLKRPHQIDETFEPAVTLIISAFNEEAVIREKLENSLAIDYPADKLDILVVSDCSNDDTDEIVRSYLSHGVRLLRLDSRSGKTTGLNRAFDESVKTDFVIFSDANAIYDRLAIRKLVRHFADEKVGYVVGRARYVESTSSAGETEGLYWDFEVHLKRWESDFCSVVGGDGAIYAIRRELYQRLETTDINDFVNPLQIVAAGYRGIFDPEAFCLEQAAGNFEKEFGRKVRIVNRSFNGLLRVSQLLNPLRYPRFSWLLVSHKLLRWLSPFFLLLHYLATLALPLRGDYEGRIALVISVGYMATLLFAFIGEWADSRGKKTIFFFHFAYYFVLINLASAYGVIKRLKGEKITTWTTVRNDGANHRFGASAVRGLLFLLAIGLVVKFASHYWGGFWELAIVLLFTLLLYTYIGYPLVLWCLGLFLKKSHVYDEEFRPSVTLLIAAYNEEKVIADKLDNSLAIDYPREKLNIVVASDGSSDRTAQIVAAYKDKGVELRGFSSNRGKISVLNDVIAEINTEIILLSDANVMYRSDAVTNIVRHFADPTIGAVSGKVILKNENLSYSTAENQYYSVEHFLQITEGETGSMIGADGAMYAIRSELYPFPDNDTILDDFVISMHVVRQNYRLIQDPEVIGVEENTAEMKAEFMRKIRIIAGGIQACLRGTAYPRRGQALNWFKFVSHKFLRWLCGPLMLVLVGLVAYRFVCSQSAWFIDFLALVFVFWGGLELLAWKIPKLQLFKAFSMLNYLTLMHLASLFGCWRGLLGLQPVTWKR